MNAANLAVSCFLVACCGGWSVLVSVSGHAALSSLNAESSLCYSFPSIKWPSAFLSKIIFIISDFDHAFNYAGIFIRVCLYPDSCIDYELSALVLSFCVLLFSVHGFKRYKRF